MRVAIYTRVSTDQQTTDNQLRELSAWAKRAGHEVVTVFDDNGISGTKGREYRKAFDAMLKGAVRREFDMVAAWSVDRLGRSLQDLLAFLEELKGAGVDLYLHQQALDTSTPSGRALFQMLELGLKFLICYFIGSIMGSMVVGRLRGGVDIRTMGSGNAGGTNALRTQGFVFALGVVIVDVGKGALATGLIPQLSVPGVPADPAVSRDWLIIACAAASVIGYIP